MRNRLFPLAVSEKKHNFVAVKQLKYTIMARLDEWIVFLKMGEIACKATASGLSEARNCLAFDKLSDDEKKAYKQHIDNLVYQKYTLETSYDEVRLAVSPLVCHNIHHMASCPH